MNCRCMIVEMPMTPDPKALAVLIDAARACYGDDSEQVRWLLNPDAVRELVKHDPQILEVGLDSTICPSCEVGPGQAHQALLTITGKVAVSPSRQRCAVAAAWRALGDPRGAADIERAHEEALREQSLRAVDRGPGSWFAHARDGLRYEDERRASDARGMEAVEEEARGHHAGVTWAREQPGITA